MNGTRILANGTWRDTLGKEVRVFVVEWNGTSFGQTWAVVVLLEPAFLRGSAVPASPRGTLASVMASDDEEEDRVLLVVDPTTFVGSEP